MMIATPASRAASTPPLMLLHPHLNMGTSKSDPGPTGDMPLLPPWAPELPEPLEDGDPEDGDDASDAQADDADADSAPEEPDPGAEETTATLADPLPWNAPRRAMNRLAGSAYTGDRARREAGDAVRGVVRALGGARGAARRAIAGRATAGRLAEFLAAAASQGVAAAARLFQLDAFLGGSVEVFLDRLVAALAPDGALTEDAVARAAAADTVDDLFDRLGVTVEGIGALDRLTPDAVATALRLYVANYALRRALQTLSSRIEERAITPERAVEVERQVRGYVHDTVDFELGGRDPASVDWNGAEGRALVARVFDDAFALLESAQ